MAMRKLANSFDSIGKDSASMNDFMRGSHHAYS
jgi:hypothetical protein